MLALTRLLGHSKVAGIRFGKWKAVVPGSSFNFTCENLKRWPADGYPPMSLVNPNAQIIPRYNVKKNYRWLWIHDA